MPKHTPLIALNSSLVIIIILTVMMMMMKMTVINDNIITRRAWRAQTGAAIWLTKLTQYSLLRTVKY